MMPDPTPIGQNVVPGPSPDLALGAEALSRLLPMHLWLCDDGRVLSVGPTLAKLLPGLASGVEGQLIAARAGHGPCPLEAIRAAVDLRRRLFLRAVAHPDLGLRGHGVRIGDGSMLVNLGFGISLHSAIQAAGLTDGDFAPSDLAMELLFLHEANRGVLAELSRFNTQLAQSRELALLQAQTDPLTGLTNRRGLEIALALALRAVSDPHEQTPFALVHLDLDHFKQVNDLLGHQAGDDLLRAVAVVLRAHVRKKDTAARIGGDEFVMVLHDMACAQSLQQMSRRLIAAIRRLTPEGLGGLCVSGSMGITICQPPGPYRAEEVMALTDRALYRSKDAGRGRATIL